MSGNSTNTTVDTNSETQKELPIVQEVFEDDKFIGYRCAKFLETNEARDVDLVFYLDLAYPPGAETAAITHLQTNLVNAVATSYGVSSGVRCDDPPLDGTSWVVQLVSRPKDYTKVDIFNKCRVLQSDAGQDCFVYEAKLVGSLLGTTTEMPDVLNFVDSLFSENSLTTNSPFQAGFLSGLKSDNEGGDSGRDNLGQPSNVKVAPTVPEPEGRNKVTIIGGFLVAAFCVAFLGIVFVLWRRRRHYLQSQEMHVTLSKSDLQQFDTEEPQSEEAPSKDTQEQEEVFPNNITFDLGTSFKDQLMGVHGAGGGGPRRPPSHVSGPYGSSVDGASESDADSWAQTDGTIGSLELQLEPITAEV